MQTLDVLNAMLGTMGEAPLNSTEDAHAFRGACLSILATENKRIQSKGWWFNMEDITIQPGTDGRYTLAGDVISVRTPTRDLAQRGRFLYDLARESYTFEKPVDVNLIRLVPFADIPESAAAYIAACAIVKFQTRYDGDTTKTKALKEDERITMIDINTDHIRNRRTNFIHSNSRLQRLKSTTERLRNNIR